jgi:hypothetical protein
VNGQARRAPGVVRMCLSGEPADLENLAHYLARGGTGPGEAIEVTGESGLYANRRDPGWRLYLTVRLTTGEQ